MWGGGGEARIIGCFFLFLCFVLEGFIFRGGKKCTFSTLSDRLFSFSVFLLNFLSVLQGMSAQNRVTISNSHFS